MINLTVKTLDSRNHQFSVEDDITVEQFKIHIADTVNIPAETQRIIYCGRVLQDASKLNEYDVDGKVVHLVQRPPPGLNNASQNPPNTNNTRNNRTRRLFQTLDHGNAMFLGSVAFPTNLIDSQGIMPSPPTHNHVGSRLNVARRMLRLADHVISLLENPNRPQQTPPEDTQEEITPVIEATVIVPSNGSEPFDEAAIFSAVNNFRSAQARSTPSTSSSDQSTSGNSSQTSNESTESAPRNFTRTSSMAELLTTLTQLQTRFAPFLQRYHDFMRNDPAVPQEDVESTQTEMNRISEVFHFLGHIYHSLSDIIVRVETQPPRPLLCRYVIQHSAVVRTGIQVEAQINLSGDRNGRNPTASQQTQQSNPSSNTIRVPVEVRNEENPTTSPFQPPSLSSNNPEVEFVMEVSPESITLDPNDLRQTEDATGQTAPPSLIQSIMQMAGQLVNQPRVEIQAVNPQGPTPASARTSQNRGNQTRGGTGSTPTPRPHVHLQQQTMQGGFDPYLPCNSHHIRRRPPFSGDNSREQQSQNENVEHTSTLQQDMSHSLFRVGNRLLHNLRSRLQPETTSSSNETNPTNAGNSQNNERNSSQLDNTPSAPPADEAPQIITSFLTGNVSDMLRGGPTLAEIMQQLPPDNPYVPGDSIITDFIMMISNHLRIGDVIMLNSGNIEPLTRMVGEIQNFFVDNILNGSRTDGAIDSGIERLINEMQPFLDTLGQIPVRDDIDIEASIRKLLRSRLPSIIRLSSRISDEPNNLRTLVDQFVGTVKELFALALRASADGVRGVDRIFDVVATRYMEGVPADLQQWTLITGRSHFRQLVSNLEIPSETISSFIVYRTSNSNANVENIQTTDKEEKMEIDESSPIVETVTANSVENSCINDDIEPLPNVVIGSEAWHSQVPEDWVPIITRDTQQRQKHQQPPFSDAYLSGMPSKRRKLVHATKGRQNLPLSQVIAENVRRAVTATGLTSVAPLETVAKAAGASEDIQTAYRGLLRSSVQEGLKDNKDFTPERFPNATSYFGRR